MIENNIHSTDILPRIIAQSQQTTKRKNHHNKKQTFAGVGKGY
jgi:hypothetical protein